MNSLGLRFAINHLSGKLSILFAAFSRGTRSISSYRAVSLAIAAVLSLTSSQLFASPTHSPDTITLASWNIEHLAERNNQGCKPRTEQDYAALRGFAKGLQADVVALQEVESKAAVHRVFPEKEWNVVISSRPSSKSYICRGSERKSTQQKVAVAIRKGVKYRHQTRNDLADLSVGNPGLRYGVVVDLLDTKPATRVLAVHLKSGCFTNNYHSPNPNKSYQVKSCAMLEKQVPILTDWIRQQWKQANQAVVLLGDFNHQLANQGNTLWTNLLQLQRDGMTLTNAMANTRGCHPKYPKPIDHILMGPKAYEHYVNNSITVHYFGTPATMTSETMLSDHCPISIKLRK